MKRKRGTSGFSTIEWICLAGIAAIAIAGMVLGVLYYRRLKLRGEDSHMQHSAERVALININQTGCVVDKCPGDESCRHKGGGMDTGYYDHLTNTIIDDLPVGYNAYRIMRVGNAEYEGEPGTMIIRVRYNGTDVILDWIEGKTPWDVKIEEEKHALD